MLFSMMGYREKLLECMARGLKEGAPPLVGKDEGALSSSMIGDDYGIYYFIPKLSELFGIPVETASYFFISSLFVIPSLFALWIFWRAYPSYFQRAISVLGIFLFYRFAFYRDLYIASHACVAVTLPFLLLVLEKQKFFTALISLFSLGIFLGYADAIRLHAGGGGMILVFSFLLLTSFLKRKEKIILAGVCLLGFFIPTLHFNYLINQRNQFLEKQGYDTKSLVNAHPVWHNLYIGFSFLEDNPYGIKYLDENADQKVNSIQPGTRYLSKEYEEILKKECFHLAKTDFSFVVKTVFYKLLKLGEVFLLLGGIGLFFLVRFQHLSKTALALYAISILFYALPGILVIPIKAYTLGFRSASILFGIHSINEALSQRKGLSFLKEKKALNI